MKLENYTPQKPFGQKHLLCLQDYTKDEILQVLSLALELKAKQKAHIPHKLLEGKTLAMIFTKASTRTRVSFETGMQQLGGHALFLSSNDTAWTGRAYSRYRKSYVPHGRRHNDTHLQAVGR